MSFNRVTLKIDKNLERGHCLKSQGPPDSMHLTSWVPEGDIFPGNNSKWKQRNSGVLFSINWENRIQKWVYTLSKEKIPKFLYQKFTGNKCKNPIPVTFGGRVSLSARKTAYQGFYCWPTHSYPCCLGKGTLVFALEDGLRDNCKRYNGLMWTWVN